MIPFYDNRLSQKIRVFISSTFIDMKKERDIIVNSIFPRLRKEFAGKMVDIMEVDLRWGIPEGVTDSCRILEICIGEVLRCAPFFIGIVGERYGSRATSEEIAGLPPAYRSALGDNIPENISITELEMRAGVFVPDNCRFSCFFIRNTDADFDDPMSTARLVENIKNKYTNYSYSESEKFEECLYETIKGYIEEILPEEAEPPYDDYSYFSHLRALKEYNSRYVPDNVLIAKLERNIAMSGARYIYGDKGSGKSACLAWLIKREGMLRDGDVFFHFASAGEGALKLSNIYARLRAYLSHITGYASGEENDADAVMDTVIRGKFKRPVTLYFDAVEQYDDPVAVFKLFALGEHNRLVRVVCAGAEVYSRLDSTKCSAIESLSGEQIRQITMGALSKFGKKLDGRLLNSIIAYPLCKNPLFLQAFVSQLRMYGSHTNLEEFLSVLLSANNFGELFGIIVSRLEEYFTMRGFRSDDIYDALAFMIYSNRGISEHELQQIVGFIPVARSVFITAVELFLIEDRGLLRLNHDIVCKTVREKLYGKNPDYEQLVAEKYIKYFENAENSERKYSELAFQLMKTGRFDSLKNILCNPTAFTYLLNSEKHNLISYLSKLTSGQGEILKSVENELSSSETVSASEIFVGGACYYAGIELAEKCYLETSDKDTRAELLAIIARAKYKLGENRFKDAISAYEKLIEYIREEFPMDRVRLASKKFLLGVTHKSAGNLELAHSIFGECRDIYDELNINNSTYAWIQDVLAGSYYRAGELTMATASSESAIECCKFLYGNYSDNLAWAYCYAWPSLYAFGDLAGAIEKQEAAHGIYSKIYNGSGAKVAWSAQNLGLGRMFEERYDEAEKLFLFSIDENNKPFPEALRPHPYTLTSYSCLASLYYLTGDISKAEKCAKLAYQRSIEKNGERHVYTANFALTLGIITKDDCLIREAVNIYKDAEKGYTPDSFFAEICLSRILTANGRDNEAREVINAVKEEYFSCYRETELITLLLAETVEKITGQNMEESQELYRYNDCKIYVTHSNSSHGIGIPLI